MEAHLLYQRALVAVAKLSIFAGAAGCGGVVTVDADDPELDVDLDEGEVTPAQPPEITIEQPAASACGAGEVDAACCDPLLVKSFSDDHLFVDPTTATSEEKACCELVATTMDTWDWSSEPPFDPTLTSACCQSGLVEGGWEKHVSCTPWGPPMPPRMPRRLARRTVVS